MPTNGERAYALHAAAVGQSDGAGEWLARYEMVAFAREKRARLEIVNMNMIFFLPVTLCVRDRSVARRRSLTNSGSVI